MSSASFFIAFIIPVLSITPIFFFQWLTDPAHPAFGSWLVLALLLTVIPAVVLVFGIREIARLRGGKNPRQIDDPHRRDI